MDYLDKLSFGELYALFNDLPVGLFRSKVAAKLSAMQQSMFINQMERAPKPTKEVL